LKTKGMLLSTECQWAKNRNGKNKTPYSRRSWRNRTKKEKNWRWTKRSSGKSW